MAFPRSFVDQLRDRVSIAEVVGRRLDWDSRKSNPARGDLWACCPFHAEKTSSFHVDDRKGYFYCFGCGEKGDAIGFLMKNDNLAFHEAVAQLAQDVGMALPERDPEAMQREEKRTTLIDVMDIAQGFFRMQLSSAAASEVRNYLERRALTPETIQRFGLGYAPSARGALSEYMKDKGVERALLHEAGLCGRRDEGTEYDRFRDRITFPIHDPRGQVIAFGGRAMSDAAQAKYLNSPETPLFSKSRTLYNFGPARAAAGKGHTIIVAEGYMDVIALAQAGFQAAVAPLGTAMTEDQLSMIWRVAFEPVLALDGDTAGQRAAGRAAELALPRLEPGKTLRFALLPGGNDPDDILKNSGVDAMRKVLEEALPLSGFLWQREVALRPLDTPERRAEFDHRVKALLGRIGDQTVRGHYRDAFREMREGLFQRKAPPKRPFDRDRAGQRFPGYRPPQIPVQETRLSGLANQSSESPALALERAILELCLKAPENLIQHSESLGRMRFSNQLLDSIRGGLISASFDLSDPESEMSETNLHQKITQRLDPALRAEMAKLASAKMCPEGAAEALDLAIARYSALQARDTERGEASDLFDSASDSTIVERLVKANTEYDDASIRGFTETEDEKKVSVQPFIDQELWKKHTTKWGDE